MKKISILGGGWLGLPLAEHFQHNGYEIKIATRSQARAEKISDTGFKPFLVDIESIDSKANEFLDSEILIVNITSKNEIAFENLICLIEQSAIKKVIFISSTSVYKNIDSMMAESEIENLSDSPLLAIEKRFQASTQFSTTIIRFAGLVGEKRHPGRFFRSGRAVQNPDSPINLIHRDDCIGIIERVIELDYWGEVFNGCSDTHPSKREFYTYAAQSIENEIPTFGENTPNTGKKVDNTKIKSLLGYSLQYPDLMNADI